MFKLEIDTGNAAFEDYNRGPEIARILRKVAERMDDVPPDWEGSLAVYDVNGNRVGFWRLED